MKYERLNVLQSLSDTQWSARADALTSIFKRYNIIKSILHEIGQKKS